jgi:hypothetical protein
MYIKYTGRIIKWVIVYVMVKASKLLLWHT